MASTPECGPHCKRKPVKRAGQIVAWQDKHCRRKCCHGRPVE